MDRGRDVRRTAGHELTPRRIRQPAHNCHFAPGTIAAPAGVAGPPHTKDSWTARHHCAHAPRIPTPSDRTPGKPTRSPELVARGPGPTWLRAALVAVAIIYLAALIHHPPPWRGLRVAGFFTESTCLFPRSDAYSIDYRLDGWSCSDNKWRPIDPRGYFPIQPDDKESRFQRFSYFYQRNAPALKALEAWIDSRHATTSDGFTGAIGGIRLAKWTRTIPPPGAPVERYSYRPLDEVPPDQRKDLYFVSGSERRARCAGTP
jgi:hypothetical protein